MRDDLQKTFEKALEKAGVKAYPNISPAAIIGKPFVFEFWNNKHSLKNGVIAGMVQSIEVNSNAIRVFSNRSFSVNELINIMYDYNDEEWVANMEKKGFTEKIELCYRGDFKIIFP